jgi:beta-lactam-binding protein with PASTA domain
LSRSEGREAESRQEGPRQGDCKIGKVKRQKGAAHESAKVVKQSPKAGKVLAAGSKVGVKLG